jgi:hypothetical protein
MYPLQKDGYCSCRAVYRIQCGAIAMSIVEFLVTKLVEKLLREMEAVSDTIEDLDEIDLSVIERNNMFLRNKIKFHQMRIKHKIKRNKNV